MILDRNIDLQEEVKRTALVTTLVTNVRFLEIFKSLENIIEFLN